MAGGRSGAGGGLLQRHHSVQVERHPRPAHRCAPYPTTTATTAAAAAAVTTTSAVQI